MDVDILRDVVTWPKVLFLNKLRLDYSGFV